MSNRSPEAEAHVFAEVYKTVYEANKKMLPVTRRMEAEITAKEAVWAFLNTQPKEY